MARITGPDSCDTPSPVHLPLLGKEKKRKIRCPHLQLERLLSLLLSCGVSPLLDCCAKHEICFIFPASPSKVLSDATNSLLMIRALKKQPALLLSFLPLFLPPGQKHQQSRYRRHHHKRKIIASPPPPPLPPMMR